MKKLVTILVASMLTTVMAVAQNNTCATATVLTGTATLTQAALTGTGASGIHQSGGTGGLVPTATGWYTFTAPSAGFIDIASCGGGADTRVWVMTASAACSGFADIAGNDDACAMTAGGQAYASQLLNVPVAAGITYYIEWDDTWDAAGFAWNFTFRPAVPDDATVTSVAYGKYTAIPLDQVQPITFSGTIANNGSNALTNVTLTTTVLNGATVVGTFTSATANLAIAASNTFTGVGTWTPTAAGNYDLLFVSTHSVADGNMTNDTARAQLLIGEEYSHFDAVNGTVGALSLTGATDGKLATNYQYFVETKIDSVFTAHSIGIALGDSTRVSIWNTDATGKPTTMVAMSGVYVFTPTDTLNGVFIKHTFPSQVILQPGTYAFAVHQYAGEVAILTNFSLFQPATNHINFGTAWSDINGFPAQFHRTFYINPVSHPLPFPDDCITATNLQSSLGGAVGTTTYAGPFTNVGATIGGEPATGYECFPDAPQLSNTVWFTFVGDGNRYFIESTLPNDPNCVGEGTHIGDSDTQFALYSGPCNALTPVTCNEDGPSATTTQYPAGLGINTEAGTTYYLMVDGYYFGGAAVTGEFCIKFKRETLITCSDPTVSAGTIASAKLCYQVGDTTSFTVTGAVAPQTGVRPGYTWVFNGTNTLASGTDLGLDAATSSFPVRDAAYTLRFIHNGTTNIPAGTYNFYSAVLGGTAMSGATAPNGNYYFDATDPACTTVSNGLVVEFKGVGETCAISTKDQDAFVGISSIAPNPATNQVNLVYNAVKADAVQLFVTDVLGRKVMSLNLNANMGRNEVNLPISDLAAGVYNVTLSNNGVLTSSKFVKQ